AYIATSTSVDRIYLTEPNAQSTLIYTSAPKPTNSGVTTSVELNRDGSYARVVAYGIPAQQFIVNTATQAAVPLGANNASIVQSGDYFAFSPADDSFYIQMQVGGSPP